MGFLVNAQDKGKLYQRFTTDYENGKMLEYGAQQAPVAGPIAQEFEGKGAVINWQTSDAAAIAQYMKVSGTSMKSVCAWGLNDQRISVYNNTSNVPLWEKQCQISSWDEVIDMTEDGTLLACGYDSAFQIYDIATGAVVWEKTTTNCVKGIQISDDGQKVFVATFNIGTQTDSYLACYQVGQSTPLWTKTFTGNYTALSASGDGSRVVFCMYGGATSRLYVFAGSDGTQIFDAPFQNQNAPGISYDGKYIVNGDYSGYIYLYEYDEGTATYFVKWHYRVNGSSAWVWGMNISADGSTVAVGTLVFLSNDYDGELYVFNTYSPVPIWVAAGFKDAVVSTDLSADGSIIAAGSWGALDNSRPDLMFYRKQSATPYFSVSSPGSIYSVDLSADGKLCMAGGKLVHARAFGMGGKLYSITSNPGGGTLAGHAYKPGSVDQAGAKIEVLGINNYFTYTDDESAYTLPYIPAGSYTIKYSAVGFVPQEIANVAIAEGQTTIQDVTLVSTGEPPVNLVATQGASYTVGLTWGAPQTGTVIGYNIYRKNFAPDFFPETPLATVPPTELSYTDNTALPTVHYYYAVSAVLAGDLLSPYSNTSEGWVATGFMASELSSYVGSAPVIDGVISPGEWTDAFKADISDIIGTRDNTPNPIGSVIAYLKVNAAKTSLYCAVENFNDVVLEDHDEVALYVDDNNDGVFPPSGDDSEGNYWAVHYASGDLIKYRPLYNTGGVGTTIEIPNAQISVSAGTGHVVYEFVIPLGPGQTYNINFNEENQSGISAFVLDDPSNYDGYWPITNLNLFNPEGYGVINFGDEDLVPPPPDNLQLTNVPPSLNIKLSWLQPDINDFNHFNIYWSHNGGAYDLLSTTIGVEFFYTMPNNDNYSFYVTTVDNGENESVPSQVVTFGGGGTYSLSGVITYANTVQTPLSGVTVVLKNGSGTVVGTTTTNATGSYTFNSLENGNYTVEPSTTKPWGGVTALDMLLFKKHIANIQFLSGIYLASGDVNNSGSLTAADVLLVQKRIALVINSFVVGDWLFNNTPIVISGGNVTQSFNGLCYGDANGSYVPAAKGLLKTEPSTPSGQLAIGTGESQKGNMTIPVYASDLMNVGSFQYTLVYDPSKLTFTNADNWYNGIENVVVGNPQPGKLTFVWAADLNGITLSNEKLVDLHFIVHSQEASSILWGDLPTTREFADYDGKILSPVYKNGGADAQTGITVNNPDLLIYPNPAKESVTLRSNDAIHSVKLFNNLGVMVFDKMINTREYKLNTSLFNPGIYL
ncbi:MAG: carboxypeptidase regulatory-like domain-containing protein, partial [Bacteroidales bacterium]|nr:carboxypeptidase regulatory-like domain-containing protein [Bacteroidales bacterium]